MLDGGAAAVISERHQLLQNLKFHQRLATDELIFEWHARFRGLERQK